MTIYSITLDKYIHLFGMYTQDEMDIFDRLRREHEDSLIDYSWNQLMEIFPQAKSVAKKYLQEEIQKCQQDLREADRIENECHDIIYRKSSKENEWFWWNIAHGLFLDPLRKGKEETIKRNVFRLSMLKTPTKTVLGGVTDRDIEVARIYPINQFIKFNKYGKGRCIWCQDKDGDDMHYYRKENKVYCYGCQKGGDAIDVYMTLFNTSFIDAVKKLTGI